MHGGRLARWVELHEEERRNVDVIVVMTIVMYGNLANNGQKGGVLDSYCHHSIPRAAR
jgi:hypothetical protein